jgi:DNA-binding CsgD family transcriptional regulator
MPTILNRRGRPPHPDILTPAEWQVLDGVRAGRTNQEIASDLGVTFHTVKYHVSNMLGKLQLEDRQALAGWRPGPVVRAPQRRWRALVPFATLKVAAAATAATLAIVAIGGISVLAIRSLADGEGSLAAEPSVASQVEPDTAEPTPEQSVITLPLASPGVTAKILDRGRMFTRFSMTALLADPLPEGIVPSAGGDLTISAITPAGARILTERQRNYQKSDDPTAWTVNIDADPLPPDTVAVEIRVEKITLIVPGTQEPPTIIGPWIGVALLSEAPPPAIDLSDRVPSRIDTGFGWAFVIDGVERLGDTLAITYHAEGKDLHTLAPEIGHPPSERLLPFPGLIPETVHVAIPAGESSLTIRFAGVRRMDNPSARYETAPGESGDWSITIPLN